jgi:hypothetical protein
MMDGWRPLLDPLSAQGFVVHANGPAPRGWRVTERGNRTLYV